MVVTALTAGAGAWQQSFVPGLFPLVSVQEQKQSQENDQCQDGRDNDGPDQPVGVRRRAVGPESLGLGRVGLGFGDQRKSEDRRHLGVVHGAEGFNCGLGWNQLLV